MTPRSTSDIDIKAPVNKKTWIKQARQLHLYLGIFFAPSIIFFALSGALQLFGLHEGHPGEPYQPPAWIAKLASIHKNQTLAERHGPPPGAAGGQQRPDEESDARRPPRVDGNHRDEDRAENKSTLALKGFFLAMAVGLTFTTFLGVYMAFQFNRSRSLVWSLLIVGGVIPVALVAMTA